jgi:hypothetical protein
VELCHYPTSGIFGLFYGELHFKTFQTHPNYTQSLPNLVTGTAIGRTISYRYADCHVTYKTLFPGMLIAM